MIQETKTNEEEIVLNCRNVHPVESNLEKSCDKNNSLPSCGCATGPIDNFEDLLPHIGEFGLFQVLLTVTLFFGKFAHVIIYMSQQFMVVTPKYYWCNIPELNHLSPEERLQIAIPLKQSGIPGSRNQYENCLMYDLNYTAIAAGFVDSNISAPTVPCRYGMEYNLTGYYTTITTEYDWVCHNDWKPNTAQSIFFLGAAVGTVFFSFISDRFGRRTAHVISAVWSGTFGVASAFSWNFTSFVVFRTLVGFSYQLAFASILVLAVEFVGIRFRTFAVNFPDTIMLGPFSATLPWIAYGLQDWRKYTLVLHAPLFMTLLIPLVIPESARWRISRGKIREVLKDVQYVASLNKKQLDPKVFQEFEVSVKRAKREQPPKTYSTWDLLSTPNVRKILVLMCFICGVQTIGFDATLRNSDNLGINPYLSYSLAALTEIPTGLVSLFTSEYFGRRCSTCVSILVASILSFVSIAALSNPIALATLAIIMRFFLNVSDNSLTQMKTEVYPTVVRSQGMGFTEIVGHFMTFLAPQILYLGKTYEYLPLLLIGCLCLLCSIAILFVPETANQRLPETLTDGEMFGKNQSFWNLLPMKEKKIDSGDPPQCYVIYL